MPRSRTSRLKSSILIGIGAGLFAGGYLGTTVSYALNSHFYDAKLVIPLAGPWIAIGTAHWGRLDSAAAAVDRTVLAFDGILQVAGLAVLVAGIVTRVRAARAEAPSRLHFVGGATPHTVRGSVHWAF